MTKSTSNSEKHHQMLRAAFELLHAVQSMSAQYILYALAFVTAALAAGSPAANVMLIAALGANAITEILENIAAGRLRDNDTIRQQVQAAIDQSSIASKMESREVVNLVARLVHEFGLVEYAVRNNEFVVLQRLTELDQTYSPFILEMRAQLIYMQTMLSDVALRPQVDEVLSLLRERLQQIPPTALHSLPAPPADFAGRKGQIDELSRKLSAGTGVAISGLVGMGGIGKTVLALIVAHRISSHYPDAQIYLDLKGTSPTPRSPAEVMTQVIWAFEPTIDLRKATREDIAATYRTMLQNRRMLLLLDNARDAAQVKPLLPPASAAVLVTSRRFFVLPGLTPLRLDMLPKEDACALLLRICPRIGEQVDEIAKACSYLPLALRIAGSTLSEHLDVSPIGYLQKLADRRKRIEVLISESDPELDLRATFDYSYAWLSAQMQAYWRMVCVFPAPFDHTAAASVWAVEEESARRALSHLVLISLLDYDESTRRYSLHDLLASFAESCLSEEERMTAQERHARHYLRVAASADALYLQGGDKILSALEQFDTDWMHIQAAQAWSTAHAQTQQAAAELCSTFSEAAVNCLSLRLHERVRVGWLEAAAAAARKLNDRVRERNALANVAIAYDHLGELRKAIEYHEQALAISCEIGDKRGEGTGFGNLGVSYCGVGEVQKAIGYHEQALAISREIGDKRGEGNQFGNLGVAYARLGQVQKAVGYIEQALAIHREIGNKREEGNQLDNLGLAYDELGEGQKAIGYDEQALAISREIGDKRGEGNVLHNLGVVYDHLGEGQKAIGFCEQALAIYREIGDKCGEGNAIGSLGVSYCGVGEAQKAVGYIEQALAIHREIGNKREEGNELNSLGVAYDHLGEGQKAIGYIEQALAISREIGDKGGEGKVLHNFGVVYDHLGEGQKAIGFWEQALAIYREIGDKRGEGKVLHCLGVAYGHLGEGQKAIGYCEQALAIYREIGDKRGEGNLLVDLCVACARLGQARKAIGYIKQVLAISQEIGDARQMLERLISIRKRSPQESRLRK